MSEHRDSTAPLYKTKRLKYFYKKSFFKQRIYSEKYRDPESDTSEGMDLKCKDPESDVCLLVNSPFRILKVVKKGNLTELKRLIEEDPSRIDIQDQTGWAPIHHAAANGHDHLIEYIISHNGNIDLQDIAGNTPLHVAVEKEQLKAIRSLIHNGANVELKNDCQMAPVHLAVDLGLTESLRTILSLAKNACASLAGEAGATPLHYCAFKDHHECAKILLEYGAKPCITCSNGAYPIHAAAAKASDRTLEVLIKHVEGYGYTREQVLSFTDKYNNTPLHSAVSSGDPEAVRVCLNAGAKLDVQQEDKSTALHFACAQGDMKIVQIMRELQPEKFLLASKIRDVLVMTPLHRAALFDHVEVIKYMIDQGAEIDARDSKLRTPLLLAAGKGQWKTVHLLLERGADISQRDDKNRNFLHLAIKYGAKLNEFGVESIKHFKNLLNEKDDYGCTPLHYASREGYLVAINDLIELGATVNLKNNDKQSPLHFAARYGRFNTCKRLLDSKLGPSIINEPDGDGLTALHLAALNGNTKIINLLMEKGAYITRNYNDNSPIHMAALNGYTKSIRVLLSVHSNLLDVKNKNGDTALHIAAQLGQANTVELLLSLGASVTKNNDQKTFIDLAIENRHTSVAMVIVKHNRWSELLHTCSTQFMCPVLGFIQYLPEVCMVVLDKCVTNSGGGSHKKEYYIEYNFEYLQCPLKYIRELMKKGEEVMPMSALNMMVRHGRVECLSHRLCRSFLQMKWRAYGMWIHSINLILYLAYLTLLTLLVTSDLTVTHGPSQMTYNSTQNSTQITQNLTQAPSSTKTHIDMDTGYKLITWIVMLFTLFNFIKEIIQMMQQKMKYFMDANNLLEWVLYVSTTVFIAPYLLGYDSNFVWEAGAIAIFLAWFNCLLFLQRFDVFGIYVVMFLEILATLLQAISVFSILLVAFGLAFNILLRHEISRAYSTPMMSIFRSTMMMLELDYMSSFNDPYFDNNSDTLPFSTLTIVFLLAFVLLMPILLVNLMIGLAVGDIEAVSRNATLKRLAMQVELHTELERRLPQWLLEKVDKVTLKEYPNKCGKAVFQVWKALTKAEKEVDTSCEAREQRLEVELSKQKNRLKDISSNMEKHYDLLKLIVQKMEIQTEADNHDEGIKISQSIDQISPPSNMWKSDVISKNLFRQNAVVSKWKEATKHADMKDSFDC